jgi:four helix bundle protein
VQLGYARRVTYSNPPDLRERSFRFACDVYDFCEELARQPGIPLRVAYQLFDAGSSVGSNLEEAKSAYSRREFTSKNGVSLKECREANYWLRMADAKGLGRGDRRKHLLRESHELISILTTIVKRLQGG